VEPFSLTEAVLRDVDDAVNFREFETCSAATLFENFGLKAIDPEATERSMTRENLRSFIFLNGDTSYILVRTTGCLWVSKEKILTQAEYGVSDNRN